MKKKKKLDRISDYEQIALSEYAKCDAFSVSSVLRNLKYTPTILFQTPLKYGGAGMAQSV